MGNDPSKDISQQLKLSNEEKQGTSSTFQAVNSPSGFQKTFCTSQFPAGDHSLSTTLAQNLQALVSKKPTSSCLSLTSLLQYQHLFHRFTHEQSPQQRLAIYWAVFPSYNLFFTAALILATKQEQNKEISEKDQTVIDTFVAWIQKDSNESPESSDILYNFIERYIPRILIYFDRWMYQSFTRLTFPCGFFNFLNPEEAQEKGFSPLLEDSVRWGASLLIPSQTFYSDVMQQTVSTRGISIDMYTKNFGKNISVQWDLVYDSNRDGSGVNQLSEAVYGYSGSSLLLVETDDGSIFGGYIPSPWPRFEKQFFGDERCFLLSLSPFSIFPPLGMSTNFIRFADKAKRNDSQLGVGFGGQRKHERLWLDGTDNFVRGTKMDMCSTYARGNLGNGGNEFTIMRVQIWGFGGLEALQMRQEVREREDKFTERSKKLDPAAFFGQGQSITENADKVIMDWMSTKKQNAQ